MGTVLGALGQLGYGFAYRVLDAQFFGVPQRRRRVFIVGCLGDNGIAPSEVLALREGLRGHLEAGDKKGKATPRGAAKGAGVGGWEPTVEPVGTIQSRGYKGVNHEGARDGHLLTGGGQTLYGQTGFAKYTEGMIKTLSATDYKRAEDNVIVS